MNTSSIVTASEKVEVESSINRECVCLFVVRGDTMQAAVLAEQEAKAKALYGKDPKRKAKATAPRAVCQVWKLSLLL